MFADPLPTSRVSSAVPHDLRVGVEHIVARSLASPFAINATVIGESDLVNLFSQYAEVRESPARLIALNSTAERLRGAIEHGLPDAVTVMVRGGLAGVLDRFRRSRVNLNRDLAAGDWRRLGYGRVESAGFQGPGALLLISLERATRHLGLPDIADRCRVGMLRSVSAESFLSVMSTIVVREYWKVRS